MTESNLWRELVSLANSHLSDEHFKLIHNVIYTKPLSSDENDAFIHLINFARTQQAENPLFEPIYRNLLYLYVLNDSRLNVLTRLDRRLRGLVANQASLVFISGHSGIGKTSLVMALRPRIEHLGSQLFVARCTEQENAPYALWREITYTIARVTDASRENLPMPIGNGRSATSTEHLIHAMINWLDQCTKQHPIVILLDDLHWADSDSLAILNRLTSRDQQLPILFIGTYRSEERDLGYPFFGYLPGFQRNRQLDQIHLSSWTRRDIERLITTYLGPCSPRLSTYLFDQAEGHPLFTVELLQNLIEQDAMPQNDAGKWLPPELPVPIPPILKQHINQRIERLGREVVQLLSIAAIVGEVWPLKIVEQLADLTDDLLLQALESALKADLITIETDKAEIYRFGHGLIKEMLYNQQIARRRKQYHAQIARQFEIYLPENVYAIAYHFYEAEKWEQAATYSLAAGKLATQQFASYSALQWYQQALEAAEHAGAEFNIAELFSIYEALGQAFRVLEQNKDAERIYQRMRNVARNTGDLIAEGQALAHLVRVYTWLYQIDQAEKSARKVLKIGQQAGDIGLLSRMHNSLASLLIIQGQLELSSEHIDKALHYALDLNDWKTQSESFRGHAYKAVWQGNYQEGEKFAQLSLEMALKTDDSLVIAAAQQILSYVQIESGSYHEAQQHIRAILDMVDMSESHHHQLPRLLNQMGYLYLELGDAGEALQWDQKALAACENSQSLGHYEMRRYSLLNIATDYLHLGDIDTALTAVYQFESIKEAANYAHFRYFNRYLLLMSEIRLAQKAHKEAIELAQEARTLAESKGMLKNIAKSHWLEGKALTGMLRFDEAIVHLEQAVTIADQIMHGSLRWKIRLTLASSLSQARKSPKAVVQTTRQLIDQTIASLSTSPLQDVFLSSPWLKQLADLEQGTKPDKPTYPAGLTQREVEVLQLVATGATNQQVADALHISVRTVNTHMTNILNKTGCENRTAATAFAIDHHLLST